ncbi:hypothetical protein WJX73_008043 [Symbiochloris irregularis]|uniref:Chalcone-flavonone isomerase family protein n=1 Tax=Symbiochloris irregularis TaxID=706552 RepID=A0AAW1PFS0_9CHLO
MEEPQTHTHFPAKFCHLSKDDCPALAGVGARSKRLVGIKNINVYSLGFYIDEQAAKKVLGPKFKGRTVESLSKDQQLCSEVIQAHSVPKTVRIVITSRMVNGDRFSSGVEESMTPVLKQLGDESSLHDFKQLFSGADFHQGLELSFSSTPEGALSTRIGDKEVGAVKSPAFTSAFFTMYLGDNPVSQDGKKSITEGLAQVLADE